MKNSANYPMRKHQRGFSLIELLIVMIILGLLASLVGPRLFGHVDDARVSTAKSQIELLGTALDSYRLDVGRYPTTEQGLDALRREPSGVRNWNGPYLNRNIPKDPWGNEYQYKSPGDHGEYDLWSYGADGEPGGEGDSAEVRSWEN
ncbi:type II secretion system major pseudopilin GspG [Desulfonatronospira sp.]|uniref:type II secretion system major pseudopilin GspG n=1 Tax=Desulfonatronospira sp. TaxID=1962951 RepID=UPI0025C4E8C9|nr:type II secretion system major pseudopilin GspG [Desulfonatronospira sp.]